MSRQELQQRRMCEAAAARYRALLSQTRDPTRRQMLEDMIAREVAAAKQLDMTSSNLVGPDRGPKIVRIGEQRGSG